MSDNCHLRRHVSFVLLHMASGMLAPFEVQATVSWLLPSENIYPVSQLTMSWVPYMTSVVLIALWLVFVQAGQNIAAYTQVRPHNDSPVSDSCSELDESLPQSYCPNVFAYAPLLTNTPSNERKLHWVHVISRKAIVHLCIGLQQQLVDSCIETVVRLISSHHGQLQSKKNLYGRKNQLKIK